MSARYFFLNGLPYGWAKAVFILTALLFFVSLVRATLPSIPLPDLSSATQAIRSGYQELAENIRRVQGSDLSSAKKAEAWGRLGMYLLAHEYYEEARQAFDQAIQLMPLDARWHYLMGYIAYLQGQMNLAKKKWQKSLGLNPEYVPAMIRLGRLLFQEGELESAKKWFEKARHQPIGKAAALVGLGQVALQQGSPEAALKWFREAQKLQPGAKRIHFYLAQAYGALGEMESAEKEMKKQGEQDVTMHDALLLQVMSLSRSAAQVNNRAVSALRSGQNAEAIALAQQAMEYDPENVHVRLTLAYAYSQVGQYAKARQAMQYVLTAKPQNAEFWYAAGVLAEIARRDEEAAVYYKKAVSLDAEQAFALFSLGKVAMRAGDYSQAISWLRKAREVAPEDAFIPFRLAYAQFALKRCQQAIQTFYDAIGMQPKNFSFLLGFVRAASTCGNEKDQLNALNAARNMYRLAPVLPVVEALAAIEAATGDIEAARDYQAQALFLAHKEKEQVPEWWVQRLKSNFQRLQKHLVPDVRPDSKEEALFPEYRRSVFSSIKNG